MGMFVLVSHHASSVFPSQTDIMISAIFALSSSYVSYVPLGMLVISTLSHNVSPLTSNSSFSDVLFCDFNSLFCCITWLFCYSVALRGPSLQRSQIPSWLFHDDLLWLLHQVLGSCLLSLLIHLIVSFVGSFVAYSQDMLLLHHCLCHYYPFLIHTC